MDDEGAIIGWQIELVATTVVAPLSVWTLLLYKVSDFGDLSNAVAIFYLIFCVVICAFGFAAIRQVRLIREQLQQAD